MKNVDWHLYQTLAAFDPLEAANAPSPALKLMYGDLVAVNPEKATDNWCYGRSNDVEGWFPAHCLSGHSQRRASSALPHHMWSRKSSRSECSDTSSVRPGSLPSLPGSLSSMYLPNTGLTAMNANTSTSTNTNANANANTNTKASRHGNDPIPDLIAFESRKSSQLSNSTGASDQTELTSDDEDETEISSFTVVDTADHAALWIPYHEHGKLVYLDPQRQILAKSLPYAKLTNPAQAPNRKFAKLNATFNPGLYRNNDLYSAYRSLKTDKISVESLSTQMFENLERLKYKSWSELLDNFAKACDNYAASLGSRSSSSQRTRPGPGQGQNQTQPRSQNLNEAAMRGQGVDQSQPVFNKRYTEDRSDVLATSMQHMNMDDVHSPTMSPQHSVGDIYENEKPGRNDSAPDTPEQKKRQTSVSFETCSVSTSTSTSTSSEISPDTLFKDLLAHVYAIFIGVHCPPSCYPSFELGRIASIYRVATKHCVELYVLHHRNLKIPSLQALKDSIAALVTAFHELVGFREEILPMPRLLRVTLLHADWQELLLNSETLQILPNSSKPLETLGNAAQPEQVLPLESVSVFNSSLPVFMQDMFHKRKLLVASIGRFLEVWQCVQQDKQAETANYLNENGTALYVALQSTCSLYRALILIADGFDLRLLFSTPEQTDMCLMFVHLRRSWYQLMYEIDSARLNQSQAINVAPGSVISEYAPLVPILPQVETCVSAGLELSVSGSVTKMYWNQLNSDDNISIHSVDSTSSESFRERKHSIAFDMKGALRGGTKRSLVTQLTLHEQSRPAETATFLATFPAFMTHVELVEFLYQRYHLEVVDEPQWDSRVRRPVRLRVVNMLRMWLDSFWSLPGNPQDTRMLFLRLDLLMSSILQNQTPGHQKVADLLAARKANNGPAAVPRRKLVTMHPPEPVMPYTLTTRTILDIPPLEMARQFTIKASERYREITREDCLYRAIEKPTTSSAISNFVTYWNNETCCVSQIILRRETPEKRADVISHFVEIATECRELNNFSTMMAIISALYSAGIHRLKATWPLVSARAKAQLDSLNRLMNSSRNFSEYRELLSLVTGPAVPFFGVCLMDLRFAQDGNSDCIDGDPEMINFAKWNMVAHIIDTNLRFQQTEYSLRRVDVVMCQLDRHMMSPPPLNDQYNVSLQREPRRPRENTSRAAKPAP